MCALCESSMKMEGFSNGAEVFKGGRTDKVEVLYAPQEAAIMHTRRQSRLTHHGS